MYGTSVWHDPKYQQQMLEEKSNNMQAKNQIQKKNPDSSRQADAAFDDSEIEHAKERIHKKQ